MIYLFVCFAILIVLLSGAVFLGLRAVFFLTRLTVSISRSVQNRFDYVNGRIDGLQAEVSLLRNRLGDWPEPKRVDPEQSAPSVFD